MQVTNRTARFLRPAAGMEKLFRDATIGLARQYCFARQLVNTGRMAIANPYTRSSVCDTTGGQPVQNVSFRWADGSMGTVNDLLQWADGRLLLLFFGPTGAAGGAAAARLSETMPIRSVQVVGNDGRRWRWSTWSIRWAICRAPAMSSAMPGRWCGPTATWPPPAKASTRR